jgi:hypothetical protein
VIFVYKTDWGVSSKIYDEIITKIKEKFPLFSKGVENKIRIDKLKKKSILSMVKIDRQFLTNFKFLTDFNFKIL